MQRLFSIALILAAALGIAGCETVSVMKYTGENAPVQNPSQSHTNTD